MKLKNIIIKPELNCNANCGFCIQRVNCHDFVKKSNLKLDLNDWKNLINETIELGVNNLHISGGEPTLYPYLIEIIEFAHSRELKININSNGLLLTSDYISRLENAGLNSCTISLYSHDAQIHENLKGIRQGFNAIQESIRLLNNSKIDLYVQTILCHQNILHFDLFLKLIFELNIKSVFVSYMEGSQKEFFPNESDILQFEKNIKPKCINIINKYFKNERSIHQNLINVIDSLFKFPVKYSSIADGIYNDTLKSCNVPYESAIILANGDVHCCNAIEYFHKPIVGNILKIGFKKIWESEVWEKIRQSSPGWCIQCPMKYHKTLFMSTDIESVINQ